MNFKQALIAHLQGERVECKATDSKWSDFIGCFGHISMDKIRELTYVGWKFRLAPRTIRVNGVEVPAPEKFALKNGDWVYLPSLDAEDLHFCAQWFGFKRDHEYLNRGLVYLNKEDAIARAKAMLLTQE